MPAQPPFHQVQFPQSCIVDGLGLERRVGDLSIGDDPRSAGLVDGDTHDIAVDSHRSQAQLTGYRIGKDGGNPDDAQVAVLVEYAPGNRGNSPRRC